MSTREWICHNSFKGNENSCTEKLTDLVSYCVSVMANTIHLVLTYLPFLSLNFWQAIALGGVSMIWTTTTSSTKHGTQYATWSPRCTTPIRLEVGLSEEFASTSWANRRVTHESALLMLRWIFKTGLSARDMARSRIIIMSTEVFFCNSENTTSMLLNLTIHSCVSSHLLSHDLQTLYERKLQKWTQNGLSSTV